MSFQTSLSGLNNAALALDVVGNNISNANTVGFKAARSQFADVFAAALATSTAPVSSGLGVATASVVQTFGQGNIRRTDNPLDMAISGSGFFRVTDGESVSYTRNGEFHLVGELDATGESFSQAELAAQNALVVNASGLRLTGYLADYATDPQGVIVRTAAPQDIVIPPTMPGSATTSARIGVNVDASAVVPATTPFSPTDAASFTASSGMTVYDAAGDAHSLTLYFAKSATANTWDVYTTIDGAGQTGPGTLTFDSSGNMLSGTASAANAGVALTIDFTGSTQYATPFAVNSTLQDGYADGAISGLSVGADGVIKAAYSNGRSRTAAQVALATFANAGGLTNAGDNLWLETSYSGKPKLDTPNNNDAATSQGVGAITGSAVEDANIDLSAEMVSLIVQQRYYQANAQGIKAQDQMLQSLAGIR